MDYDFRQAGYLLWLSIPLSLLYWSLFRYRQSALQSYAPSTIISQLLLPRSKPLAILKTIGLNMSFILACFALMGPKIESQKVFQSNSSLTQIQTLTKNILPQYKAHDVIFLIDTSASMTVPDTKNGQTRLATAKEIVEEVINLLHGESVGLYAFTSELVPLSPPTLDYLFVYLQLNQMGINEGDVEGTHFLPVLHSLKTKISPSPNKLHTIILISDGGDNSIEQLEGSAKEKAIQSLLEIIPNPVELNLRLFTVGVGSEKESVIPDVEMNGKPVYSKLNTQLLKLLAEHGRGSYYEANQWPSWDLAHDLLSKMEQDSLYVEQSSGRKNSKEKQTETTKSLYYQIPLGLAIILLCAYLILPDVRPL